MAFLVLVVVLVILTSGRRPHAHGARAGGAAVSLELRVVYPTAAAAASYPLPSLVLPHYLVVFLKKLCMGPDSNFGTGLV